MAADNKDEIEFSLTGLKTVLDGFLQVQKAVAATATAMAKLGTGAPVSGGNPLAVAPPGSPVPRAPSATVRANQAARYAALQQTLAARVQGAQAQQAAKTQAAQARAQTVVLRAQIAQTRAQATQQRLMAAAARAGRGPQNFQQRLASAIKTSRFNVGNASPLVGRALNVLGPGAEAAATSPIGLAAGAAAAAAAALFLLSKNASELGTAFSRFEIATGSGARVSSQLQAAGVSGGLSAERVAAIGQSIQDRITSDPTAQAAGLRLGVYNQAGPYGSQDYGRQELQVLKALRSIADPTERLRLARSVGAEDLLPAANVSRRQQSFEAGDASLRARLMSPDFLTKSADFQASLGRISAAVDNLMTALSPTILPRITDFLNGLASGINRFADWVDKHQGFVDSLVGTDPSKAYISHGAAQNGLLGGGGLAGMLTGGGLLASGGAGRGLNTDNLITALDNNTSATQGNTGTLKKSRMAAPGSYGNATRQGAAPGDIQSYTARRISDMETLRLSAI